MTQYAVSNRGNGRCDGIMVGCCKVEEGQLPAVPDAGSQVDGLECGHRAHSAPPHNIIRRRVSKYLMLHI
jgi:hypothetical protein